MSARSSNADAGALLTPSRRGATARRYYAFIDVSRRFFMAALIPAAAVIAFAPISSIRALGFIAFACAGLGLSWQLIASSHDVGPKLRYANAERREPRIVRLPAAEPLRS